MASATFPKPGFSINTLGANDIGLIKLSQPITDIDADGGQPRSGARRRSASRSRWSASAPRSACGGGMHRRRVRRSRTASRSRARPFGVSDTNLLCFIQTDNKGKCQGDSGGPSFAMIDGRATIVGVTSFGDQNCAQFGADTRTDAEQGVPAVAHPPARRLRDRPGLPERQVCFNKKCIAQPFSDTGIGSTCTAGTECDSGQCADGPDGKRCTEMLHRRRRQRLPRRPRLPRRRRHLRRVLAARRTAAAATRAAAAPRRCCSASRSSASCSAAAGAPADRSDRGLQGRLQQRRYLLAECLVERKQHLHISSGVR